MAASNKSDSCGGLLSCYLHPPGHPQPQSMAEFLQDFHAYNLFSIPWWLEYAVHAYHEDPNHMLIEFGLVVFILVLLFRRPYSPEGAKLSKAEEDELIAEWEPEPLVPPEGPHLHAKEPRLLESVSSNHVKVDGKSYLNFASSNFLDLAKDAEIKQAIKTCIEKYGVGSCGPRGFYGTIDVHLNLENDLAKFLGTEEAIIYSDSLACVSSVIPAFAQRGEMLMVDDAVHFGIQQGLTLSRANVIYFRHNDMAHLRELLQEVADKDSKNPNKKLRRRFIVTEGVFETEGDMCPLPEVLQLGKDFKFRVLLDDSLGMCALGPTGRGSPEHWGIPVSEVDLYVVSMDHAMATQGGFCAGHNRIIDHQRLNGAGYCFSASAPPYTARVAQVALTKTVEDGAWRGKALRKNAQELRKSIHSALKPFGVTLVGGPDLVSPLLHLRLTKPLADGKDEQEILRAVADIVDRAGILVAVSEYIPAHRNPPRPSIKLFVSCSHTKDELKQVTHALRGAFSQVLGHKGDHKQQEEEEEEEEEEVAKAPQRGKSGRRSGRGGKQKKEEKQEEEAEEEGEQEEEEQTAVAPTRRKSGKGGKGGKQQEAAPVKTRSGRVVKKQSVLSP
eukprot:g68611.t1